MGKNFKKILAFMFCLVMMVASMPLGGFVGLELPDWSLDFTASAVSYDSGSCGDNVTYVFDSATGTLTISGSGDMASYSYIYSYSINPDTSTPWYSYRTSIKSVVIESGVTRMEKMHLLIAQA